MLPDPEFLERLQSLDGTPPEILADQEFMQLMMPLLRADFELAETYCYSEGPPLNFSISVYGGLHDKEIEREHLEAWGEQTNTGFILRMFEGGHFFLHQAEKVFLQTLRSELTAVTRALA
jgi:medium-chain acyl-[acyl-carrier-protein] hydrolase